MSDSEGEWKPKQRPQSTMAQTFSAALDSAFMLDSDVDNLSQSVQQKQQLVTIQSRELEALEARIREAEERLKGGQKPSSSNEQGSSNGSNREQARAQLSSPTDEDSSGSATNSSDASDHHQNQNGEGRSKES